VPLVAKELVADEKGATVAEREIKKLETGETYLLCRCGKSGNKPLCDGSHVRVDFRGEETASRAAFEELVEETLEGEGWELLDASSLCASARWCHQRGGTWQLVQNAQTPAEKQVALHQCCQCPSGRLVIRDTKTGKIIEEEWPEEIVAMEDAPAGKMGPLCVRGGVEVVSSQGKSYPRRQRMTLCRCGKSGNKPWCDSSHLE
jgi:CDGSH-type Zn-finger protein